MAWSLPDLPVGGSIATVANWAAKVINSLRYMKGLDGPVTIGDDLTVDNLITPGDVDGVDVSAHDVATTGVHGVGADHLAKAEGAQYTAINKAGDTGLGQTFKRAGDDADMQLHGGDVFGSHFKVFGKNHATDPGALMGYVPDAAKTAFVQAFEFSGATDSPEMTNGVIPTARLKEYEISTYTGNASGAARQITTGFQCKFVAIYGTDFNDADANIAIWFSFRVAGSLYMRSDNTINASANIHLDAADGFWIGDAVQNEANKNAFTFEYVAIG